MSSNALILVGCLVLFTLTESISSQQTCLFNGCDCQSLIAQSYNAICEKLPTQGFPARNFDYKNDKKIEIIKFEGNNFDEIPDDSFKNITTNYLVFIQNNLKRLKVNTFRGLVGVYSMLRINEKALDTIEPGSLQPFYQATSALNLWQSNIDDDKYQMFYNELKNFRILISLDLSDNNLTELKAGQFDKLLNMTTFVLRNNQVSKIDENTFSGLNRLGIIQMNNNKLTNLSELFSALGKIPKSEMYLLDLSANQIESLELSSSSSVILNELNSLIIGNMIKKVNNNALKGVDLSQLNTLDLKSNQIDEVDATDFFARTPKLKTLILDYNRLSKLPDLTGLKDLTNLNLADQNGQLTRLDDFSFDTNTNNAKANLQVVLSKNSIIEFSDKTFCTRSTTWRPVQMIQMSYSSMEKFDRCYTRQMARSEAPHPTIIVDEPENGSKNYSSVCNCDLILFAKFHKVEIGGVCQGFSTDNCPPFVYYCDPRFDCPFNEPTTIPYMTSSPQSITSTNSSPSNRRQLSSCQNKLFIIAVLFALMML